MLLAIVLLAAGAWFWMWLARRQDRAEPETWAQTFALFGMGLALALYAGYANVAVVGLFFPGRELSEVVGFTLGQGQSLIPVLILIVAASTEEILKFAVLWLAVYAKPCFNQIGDGVIFGIMVGLGFSVMENINYMWLFASSGSGTVVVFGTLMRTVATTMLHITATGLVGYGLGRAKFLGGRSRSVAWLYLVLAIVLHAVFNITVSLPAGILAAIPLVLIAFVYLMVKLHKPESRLVWTPVWVRKL